MEEHIGEQKIRYIVGIIDVIGSLSVCLPIILNGEILTGSIFSLATHQITPGGNLIFISLQVQ
jgi:hypothetical protein